MGSLRAATIAVVVPTYRDPVLLTEAIESILAQKSTFDIVTLIVNDGCPLRETDVVSSAFSFAFPNVFYLRKANGGPSSARNRGIDFILHNWPEVGAIFFLDADNRLRPNALQTAFNALCSAPAEIGWIYTNIDTFGIRWSGHYTIPYSPLLHVIAANMCDTGSLVSRKVFESGVRFDEDSRSGFEDWDFWLQCVEKGFFGKPISFGLEYRKRPESRNERNKRNVTAIMNYIRARHKHLSAPDTLLNWEHSANPRYLYGVGRPTIPVFDSFTDPAERSQSVDVGDLGEIFWSSFHVPDHHWFPSFLAWGIPELRECLERAKLLHNVFFLMERCARSYDFATLTLANSDKTISIEVRDSRNAGSFADRAVMWMCSGKLMREVVHDQAMSWVNSLGGERPMPTSCEVAVSAPGLGDLAVGGKASLDCMFLTIRAFLMSEYRDKRQSRWYWRPQQFSGRDKYYEQLCNYLAVDGLMPRLSKSTLNIGLVLPSLTYGGADKVALALGRTLAGQGIRVHLFVVCDSRVTIIDEFHASLTTINILAEKTFPKWGGPLAVFGQKCFGADSQEISPGLLSGYLAGLDLVINCHSAPMNSLMHRLREMGSKTATYLHVTDITKFGRFAGHPYLAVSFEQAYDLVLTCSNDLKKYLHALGLPEEKILPIRNAAGFSLGIGGRQRAEKHRMQPRTNRMLRALYIGRLDRQKGVDRLLYLIAAFRSSSTPVDVRIIGAALLDTDEDWGSRFSSVGVQIEPPLYDSRDLEEAYTWADVLLLPSRWEGAPLVIPECQQTGCIPIAVQVGGVEELIEHAIDGVLISNSGEHQLIMDFCAWIETLIVNDSLRMQLAEKALARGAASTWDQNFEPLIEWLRSEFAVQIAATKGAGVNVGTFDPCSAV
jgi:glycosyltransferase involved in cell wall biosynthesis